MAFRAPGADIVGFEYKPESEEDLAAVASAVKILENPLDLFAVSPAAECSITTVNAAHSTEDDDHDDHGHEDHDDDHDDHAEKEHDEHGHDDHDEHAEKAHDDHDDHDEHAEEAHDDHDDHDEHAEEAHDDHDDHDEHAEKAHDDHDDHDEHAEKAHDDHEGHDDHDDHAEESHAEFAAEYVLACASPSAIDKIEFTYFAKFQNALEVEVQVVTSSGAQAFEVSREDPVLNLDGVF